ncbi:MAG: hypothetical protein HOV81_29450 [Kofleriaceae bacterium]|nr:hypothetical protein [Kofleriaceae bacterium]
MARATWVLSASTVLGVGLSIWLYLDNRELRSELATQRRDAATPTAPDKVAAARTTDPWNAATRTLGPAKASAAPLPTLPEPTKETRLERRQRRQAEFAAMFGRGDGETDDEYRARIVPLIKGGLLIPRQRVDEMRRQAEQLAGVTAEQSKKLDKAFENIYADALDYTNKAVADGLLSPYERNVSGWLEYAGGLGGILNDANGQIGQILSPDQLKTMSASGFEWGEYLGFNAPWENLTPPPPAKPR